MNRDQGEPRKIGIASGPGLRALEHPERNLTLLFISTSIVLAFVGTSLGAFTLADLSGVSTNLGKSLFPIHPYLQIFGFVAEFVIGVSYSLLPRFKTGRVPHLGLGYATYALVTCANVLFILQVAFPAYSIIVGPVSEGFMTIASLLYASQVFSLALRHMGGFPETNPFMILSSISLVLISLSLLISQYFPNVDGEVFSPQMILLSLVGFAGSMIYAVEIRSVSFRQSDYRKGLARFAPKIQGAAIGITFFSIIFSSVYLSVLGALLFLSAALIVILAIRIFEFAHPLMYRPAMNKMHFSILRYNEVGIISGSVWLLFGCSLGAILIASPSEMFFFRDSFIHSIAIGFIGSTITVFAPMLLPALLGRKAPVTGLSYGPILLLNAGILLRIGGDSTTLLNSSSNLPIWESLSGALILGAMVWLLVLLPRIGKHSVSKPQKISNVGPGLKDIRDARLFVTRRKSNLERSISLWFVEREGVINLVPMHGTGSEWYQNVLSNSKVRLEIDHRSFTGNAKSITERHRVDSIINLFKDKYGERVFNNFYKGPLDCAVEVPIEGLR
ncbi:MAG TPA: nitroreductase/quinone reductase family protein [Nitrososphaerales archaeon]|nr:nitroreductase/quinone reductase family protein [Nitrososphaerales archaeon]